MPPLRGDMESRETAVGLGVRCRAFFYQELHQFEMPFERSANERRGTEAVPSVEKGWIGCEQRADSGRIPRSCRVVDRRCARGADEGKDTNEGDNC